MTWHVNPAVFDKLDVCWGQHKVDRFADHESCQQLRFNSRCWNLDTETGIGVTRTELAVPNSFMVTKVIMHAQICSAIGSPIVLEWHVSRIWPDLNNAKLGYHNLHYTGESYPCQSF